jgi:hypothetical protein
MYLAYRHGYRRGFKDGARKTSRFGVLKSFERN